MWSLIHFNANVKEELIADFLADALFGQNVIVEGNDITEQFATEIQEQDQTLWEKIKQAIQNFINLFKDVDDIQQDLKRIAKKLQKMQSNLAKQKTSTENGEVRKSLNKSISKADISKNIETVSKMESVADLKGNEFAKSEVDLVTQVLQFFNSIGNNVESEYGNIALEKAGIKSSIGHGIGRNKAIAFKAVPNVIKQGKIIDYQLNWKNRGYDTAVFAAPITINSNKYFLAAIVIVEKEKNSYYLHEVALQKIESNASFKTGTEKIGTPGDASDSIYKLLQKLQNVNPKVDERKSLNVDSQGNTLTEAQQEYFKDSKVRDDKGNLLVCYHGTDADFNSFDANYISQDNKLGYGFYFVVGRELQYSYKHPKKVYLNITNPITDKSKIFSQQAITKFCNELDIDFEYDSNDYDLDVYERLSYSYTGEVKQFLEKVVDVLGIDGVLSKNRETAVIFNSNQAKLTTNENPTESEDIRYSKNIDLSTLPDSELSDAVENETITIEQAEQELMRRYGKIPNSFKPKQNVVLTVEETQNEDFATSEFINNVLRNGKFDAGMTEEQKAEIIKAIADNKQHRVITDEAALSAAFLFTLIYYGFCGILNIYKI